MVVEWDELQDALDGAEITEVFPSGKEQIIKLTEGDDRYSDPQKIIDIVKSLDIDGAVCGGAMMVLRGIKPYTHDIDILVTNEVYKTVVGLAELNGSFQPAHNGSGNACLRNSDHVELLNVEGFIKIPNIKQYLERLDYIGGIWMVTVPNTIEWKKLVGRTKDLNDVKLLEKYLNDTNAGS